LIEVSARTINADAGRTFGTGGAATCDDSNKIEASTAFTGRIIVE